MTGRAARRNDEGSATVWLLAVGMVVLTIAMAGVAVGRATIERHRAGGAADLAALAGAVHAIEGRSGACGAAARIAAGNGGRLTACALDGLEVTVTVRVGRASGRARAGPVGA